MQENKLITFKCDLELSQKHFDILNQERISLNTVATENLICILPYIEEWKCNVISGRFITKEKEKEPYNAIFKDISNICFSRLTYLQLCFNFIDSVEILSQIFMPNLQGMNLAFNEIISVKPMRKANCPSLCFLELSNTMINDGESLAEIMCSSNQESELQLEEMMQMQKKASWLNNLTMPRGFQDKFLMKKMLMQKVIRVKNPRIKVNF